MSEIRTALWTIGKESVRNRPRLGWNVTEPIRSVNGFRIALEVIHPECGRFHAHVGSKPVDVETGFGETAMNPSGTPMVSCPCWK
ncbi:hypothetical protein [Parapedobacter tibetensis]|uniref:hypothetical protein n=1 Tax=Parapedobacter tibetensis TaxID=2972951 RepID=UPI0021533F5F|nr:hypothetical protein [Parapedobacter tibetensis]